ncbi:MAG: spermidine/putrescine ABC transporter permease PotB, partial [Clostridia bacterium]
MDSRKRDLRFSLLLKLPMYLWAIVFVFVALLYILGLSFLTFSNYARLADPQYLLVLLNSLKLSAITTALCIVIGYPFGYLMARLSPAARSILMLLIMVPFWTNALIRIYGWRILLMAN